MKHDFDQACAAQKKLGAELSGLPQLAGIGLTTRGGDYLVRVLLTSPAPTAKIPSSIDDIPVTTEVVGSVRAL
jgi:hypothetical protein